MTDIWESIDQSPTKGLAPAEPRSTSGNQIFRLWAAISVLAFMVGLVAGAGAVAYSGFSRPKVVPRQLNSRVPSRLPADVAKIGELGNRVRELEQENSRLQQDITREQVTFKNVMKEKERIETEALEQKTQAEAAFRDVRQDVRKELELEVEAIRTRLNQELAAAKKWRSERYEVMQEYGRRTRQLSLASIELKLIQEELPSGERAALEQEKRLLERSLQSKTKARFEE